MEDREKSMGWEVARELEKKTLKDMNERINRLVESPGDVFKLFPQKGKNRQENVKTVER